MLEVKATLAIETVVFKTHVKEYRQESAVDSHHFTGPIILNISPYQARANTA